MGSYTGYLNRDGDNNIFMGNYVGYNQVDKKSDVAIGNSCYIGYPDDTISLSYQIIDNGYTTTTCIVSNEVYFKNKTHVLQTSSLIIRNYNIVKLFISITDVNLISNLYLSKINGISDISSITIESNSKELISDIKNVIQITIYA